MKDWALPEALGGAESVPLSLSDSVSLGDMAHRGEQGGRVRQIQAALKVAVAPNLVIDGDFGPVTEAVVKTFQAAKQLEVDGIVGPATAKVLEAYLSSAPPPPIPAPPTGIVDWKSGKGSWYAQYEGHYKWRDPGDAPGSSALGVPDNAQGVSFLDPARLGQWFEVEYPNGKRSIEQQTDIGPSAWTGKKIDISAAAADRAGYSPNNFPTGELIKWRPVRAAKGSGRTIATSGGGKVSRYKKDDRLMGWFTQIDRIESMLNQLLTQQARVLSLLTKQGVLAMGLKEDVDNLVAEVEENKTVKESVMALLTGMNEMLTNLQGQIADPAAQQALQAAIAALDAQNKELADAVVANTRS